MRHSVETAEWSDEREEQYRRDCHAIAFRAQIKLVQRELQTFVIANGADQLLVTALRPKRLWYETWLCLRERFPEAAEADRMKKASTQQPTSL